MYVWKLLPPKEWLQMSADVSRCHNAVNTWYKNGWLNVKNGCSGADFDRESLFL